MGISVIMDLIHGYASFFSFLIGSRHSSKNAFDGLNQFDGTGYQYFHEGEKGDHKQWGSKLFNYSKWEV
jgi:1,4-alpha-glucan branching enzyme